MSGDRTTNGLEIRLAPQGAGRFFEAAFLLVWLCFWAVGEVVVLAVLVKGAIALFTGRPPGPGHGPLELAPALAVGAFMLLWLALWTLGGIAATYTLLSMIWAEDRLTAHGGGLTLSTVRGPLRKTREFPRDTLRSIVLIRRNHALGLETDRETVELSSLGTIGDRQQAATTLESELGLADAAASAEVLPSEWQDVVTPEGTRCLVPNLGTRRTQARVAAVAAFAAAALTFLLGRSALENLSVVPVTLMALAATIGLAWGATWLARGRMEWRIGSGRLVLARRFGADVRELFEARRLALNVRSDSDGDEWFTLEGLSESAPVEEPVVRWRPARKRDRRQIASKIHDPTPTRRLGAWLASAAGIPFEDRTTDAVRTADLTRLRNLLKDSGRWGRFADRMIDRLEKRPNDRPGADPSA